MAIYIRRRELIVALGGGPVWPLAQNWEEYCDD
jgi:hypothetical protein